MSAEVGLFAIGGESPPELRWFACEHPERPTDPFVVWHEWVGRAQPKPCAACLIKAQALRAQHPGDRNAQMLVVLIEAAGRPLPWPDPLVAS